MTRPRPEGEEVKGIQVLLQSDANPLQIRDLRVRPSSPFTFTPHLHMHFPSTPPFPTSPPLPQSEHMARLVKVPGIVIQASGVRAKATKITIQCRSCRALLPNIPVRPGLEGYSMPRKCATEQAGRPKCPVDPFFIVPDKCKCVDFQVSHTHHLWLSTAGWVDCCVSAGAEAAGEPRLGAEGRDASPHAALCGPLPNGQGCPWQQDHCDWYLFHQEIWHQATQGWDGTGLTDPPHTDHLLPPLERAGESYQCWSQEAIPSRGGD